MITFDPHTLKAWKDADIHEVTCKIIRGGCAGMVLDITPGIGVGEVILPITGSMITCAVSISDAPILSDAYITHTGEKWILSSTALLTHCGCGKSFSIKTGKAKIDAFLKQKAQHKKHHHI